jgi:hypothetical protein
MAELDLARKLPDTAATMLLNRPRLGQGAVASMHTTVRGCRSRHAGCDAGAGANAEASRTNHAARADASSSTEVPSIQAHDRGVARAEGEVRLYRRRAVRAER